MRCPNCNRLGYQTSIPCPHCQFSPTEQFQEELDHIIWLLDEIDTWQTLSNKHRVDIRQRYDARKKSLEIELGLRLPPFTQNEALDAWPRLLHFETLRQNLADWLAAGQLNPANAQPLIDDIQRQSGELVERLEDHPRPKIIPSEADRLNIIANLLEIAADLSQNKGFTSPEAEDAVRASLLAKQERLEINLGLRPDPALEVVIEEPPKIVEIEPDNVDTKSQKEIPLDVEPPEPAQPVEEQIEPTPPPPPAPRIPFRERLWQTLLSERTLQALLFLGIFLLFSAALSFVAWGWKNFSAPVRVAVPTGFTALFFALGWYVRAKTPMYRSGIALSAIAALLIPIDFYTIYVNFHIPPDFWPFFWLITSMVCLAAYTVTTIIIRSRFFAYLIATAAGSAVLALIQVGHQTVGLSLDWRSSGLSILALALIVLAALFEPADEDSGQRPLSILATPFRYLSLLTISIIMLLTFGWRFIQRDTYDMLHYALTVNWWIGGFVFGWAAIQYRSRALGLLAMMTLPVATYLTQASLFNQAGINPAWHAFGWALLVPLYLLAGYKLLEHKKDTILHDYGRAMVRWSVVLMAVSALWSLTDLSNSAAAASSHAVLAGSVVLAALLWRQPKYLYGASMLSFSAGTFVMTELNLTTAQLSVGWASLAIAHIIIAINLGTRFPIPAPNFAKPLAIAGYVIGAIATLPTLFPHDAALLTYSLGNFIALTAWGARLAHIRQPGFVSRNAHRKPLFHWFTALLLPFWLWSLITSLHLSNTILPLAMAALAWAMFLLSYRLTRIVAAYRRPWYLTCGLISIAAPLIALALTPSGFTPGITLVAVGLLYFVDAVINRQSVELAPAGLITAWGYILVLERLSLSPGAVSFGFAGLIAVYILIGLQVERQKSKIFTHKFLTPLYITAHFLTLVLLARLYLPALSKLLLNTPWSDGTRLWGAGSQLLLAIVYGFFAWARYQKRWAHVSSWLAAVAAGFVAMTFSTSTGSVVAEFALIAAAFILTERALHHLRQNAVLKNRQQAFIRLTWRLFKQALLVTGWAGSIIVIGLALFYNLLALGGGQAERIWAITALGLMTALYGLSAYLFRQARFVWFAAALSIVPWTILAYSSWFTAIPLTPAIYVASWSILAWALFLAHLRLRRNKRVDYATAPRIIGHALLVISILWSIGFFTFGSFLQASGLLLVGTLYLIDSIVHRQSLELAPGVLVTSWGYLLFLDWLGVSFDALGFALALLVAGFVLTGLWVERKRVASFSHRFLSPLYLTAHLLTVSVLWWVYARPFDDLFFGINWTDPMRMWGAASQVVLAIVYGLYAWGTFKERWAHFAIWLMTFGGAFVAIIFGSGRGVSAAEAALGATLLILLERGLRWMWRSRHSRLSHRQQIISRLTWRLYRRPLLVAGLSVSAIAIGLALVRNLLILDGGQVQKIWAVVALWIVVGLYGLSARLFRRAAFVWLAAPLSFAPWTILTNLGWFTPYRPTLPGYALSWALLAWTLLLIGLMLDRRALPGYGLPLKFVANWLIPFSLLWSVADIDTARFTFGLAVGFYALSSVMNHRYLQIDDSHFARIWKTKFFYPALGLLPLWCVYLTAWLLPTAQRAHYGLLFLIFGPLGLVGGQWLYRQAPGIKLSRNYGLPAYITGYTSLVVGTGLVAHEPALLAVILLFDAILMLVSAKLFKQPAWVFIATVLSPLSLFLAMREAAIPVNRYGWWLIGLASIYLLTAWILRRVKLRAYGAPVLVTSFALIALSLPPSSLDQTGALWGYGGAVLLYAICAFWLGQPLFLSAASTLAIVPFGVLLQVSPVPSKYYGLALLDGSIAAIGIGWLLDKRFGAWQDFPWANSEEWFEALIDRLLKWWAFPLYSVGFGLVVVSPFFSGFSANLIALNFLLMMPIFGWAVYRFRLRGWLVATAIAGHLSALFYIGALGWWRHPDIAQAWLRFLPVTLVMSTVALFIAFRRNEESPLRRKVSQRRWSYPLYIIIFIDIIIGQFLSLVESGSWASPIITIVHALIIVVFVSVWLSSNVSYISLGLGLVAVIQWGAYMQGSVQSLIVILAMFAFGYGLIGYSLTLLRDSLSEPQELRPWLAIWELPLQRFAMGLSLGTLVPMSLLSLDLFGWLLRGMLGLPFRYLVDLATVQMVIGTLGFLGLLYVIAAFTHQWLRLGYLAIGMLISSWILYVFFIREWDNFRQIQWYTIPVGIFLLGIAYMEWQRGYKTFARRLDYVAMLLMLGSLFWQTLLFGWGFALLLGAEGLAAFYWGSARRLRRFLYAGMVGVVFATVGQLLNSLRSVNQWIVFGIIGLLLVLVAVVVERKLEDIKSWQDVLESWE